MSFSCICRSNSDLEWSGIITVQCGTLIIFVHARLLILPIRNNKGRVFVTQTSSPCLGKKTAKKEAGILDERPKESAASDWIIGITPDSYAY